MGILANIASPAKVAGAKSNQQNQSVSESCLEGGGGE
jgi:hypothetical protein